MLIILSYFIIECQLALLESAPQEDNSLLGSVLSLLALDRPEGIQTSPSSRYNEKRTQEYVQLTYLALG